MTLQLLNFEFPYIVYEENLIFFFISAVTKFTMEKMFHRYDSHKNCVLEVACKIAGGWVMPLAYPGKKGVGGGG
jgi:hypothetical protein